MPCFWPLPATPNPRGGKPLVHSPLTYTPKPGDIKLPCGRCFGCRLQTTQNWAVRCLHESQLHDANAFLTLTIDSNYHREEPDTHPHQDVWMADKTGRDLPTIAQEPAKLRAGNLARVDSSLPREEIAVELGGSLNRKTHQKLMKRLRERIAVPIKFYMCGEYGEKLGRPHYHYLIFGYNFPDKKYSHTSKSGERLYESELLNQAWPFGKAWIGNVTYESCAYVAAYVMKKITGRKADEHYRRTDEHGNDYWIEPEFALMSRGGRTGRGLAAEWWNKFSTQMYTIDAVIKDGTKLKPPRYYDKLLAMLDPIKWEETKFNREMRAKKLAGDNTPARLAVKETVAKAKMALKQRNLESTP